MMVELAQVYLGELVQSFEEGLVDLVQPIKDLRMELIAQVLASYQLGLLLLVVPMAQGFAEVFVYFVEVGSKEDQAISNVWMTHRNQSQNLNFRQGYHLVLEQCYGGHLWEVHQCLAMAIHIVEVVAYQAIERQVVALVSFDLVDQEYFVSVEEDPVSALVFELVPLADYQPFVVGDQVLLVVLFAQPGSVAFVLLEEQYD